jgi:hypothetical protein
MELANWTTGCGPMHGGAPGVAGDPRTALNVPSLVGTFDMATLKGWAEYSDAQFSADLKKAAKPLGALAAKARKALRDKSGMKFPE